MPPSTNIHSFADVHQILTTALERGELHYRLPVPGKANSWMQRANRYAKLLADEKDTYPFDEISWRISDVDKCLIIIGPNVPLGELTTPEGIAVTVKHTVPRDLFPEGLSTPAGETLPATKLEKEVEDLAAKIRGKDPLEKL